MPASIFTPSLHRLRVAFTAAAVILAAARPAAAASSPQRIGFQGKLLDLSNDPRDGSFNITFRIFDVPSGGTALWSETQSGVQVTNGAFSVQLGTVTALATGLFTGASAYLEIEVPPDLPMTPRHQLLMSPMALRALLADNLQPGDTNYVQARSSLQAGASFHVASGTVAGPFQATGISSFTATGNQTFSLNTSSGIRLQAGTLRVEGSGGVDAAGQVKGATVTAVSGLLLPQGVPSTIEGSARWDAAADKLSVGTGAGSKTMADTDSAETLTNKTLNSTGGNTVDATHLRTRLLAAEVPLEGMTLEWDSGAGQWFPVFGATVSVVATPFTPGANRVLAADTIYLTPITIPGTLQLRQIRYRVTAGIGGCSGDVGLYDALGNLAASGGANSAPGGTAGAQAVLVAGAPKTIQPGQYYVAIVFPCAPTLRATDLATASAGVIKGLGTITLATGAGTTLPCLSGAACPATLTNTVDWYISPFMGLND